jgi:hypothetical protein
MFPRLETPEEQKWHFPLTHHYSISNKESIHGDCRENKIIIFSIDPYNGPV